MATQINNTAWLEWIAGLMGVGSRQTHTATLPSGRFHCLLDELPLHLIPRQFDRQHRRRSFPDQPLFFNPNCLLLPQGQIPAELDSHRHLLENFSPGTVAWVRDPSAGSWQPFWLGPSLEALVWRLHAGEPVSDALFERTRSLLAGAGILTCEAAAERRAAEWAEIVRKSSRQFREKGYAAIGNLIHPFNLAALRRYYRHVVRHREIQLGDEQCPLRYGAHNESVARFFHYQITNAVSAIVGESVKPSYVYWASYVSGAELKKHIDREQCQFSVTLSLDFSPEPELATPWPIRLDTPEGSVTVYQALGDGLVYMGTKLPHYRTPLAEGYTSTSAFFHYVSSDFSGPLD
jgi:hypothetical protein